MKKSLILLFFLSIFIAGGCGSVPGDTSQDVRIQDPNLYCEDTSFQLSCPQEGDKIAVIATNVGIVKFKLFPNEAPETVKNFETLANQGKYDGSIFHRVIKDFMIQGGDFERNDGTGGYSYNGKGTTIAEEFSPKLTHIMLAVSMAKTSAPHTTGSQFFIVHGKDGTHHLDNVHSVFGQVFFGGDIVNKIANLKTDPQDKPVEDVIMKEVRVIEFKPEK